DETAEQLVRHSSFCIRHSFVIGGALVVHSSFLSFPRMDRYFSNHGRRVGTNRSLRPWPLRYSTRHVQPFGHPAEDAELAAHHRGLAEVNIEPAPGRARVVAAAGADRSFLVLDRFAELRRQPIAEMPDAQLSRAGGAAALDHFQFRVGPTVAFLLD